MQSDYERLLLLFRRAHTLPALPGITLRLIQAVDSGEASARDLEQLISADQVLAATVLRVANSAALSTAVHEVSTMRQAVMRLGQKSVRALAVSLMMQKFTYESAGQAFRPQRLAHHSLCVGFLARYLFARRAQRGNLESNWSGDEIFASGLLHDLAIPLLAQVAPEVFARIAALAERRQTSFQEAFERVYQRPMKELAVSACKAWGLPDLFARTFEHMGEPWTHIPEFSALCCINYANFLAAAFGANTEEWPLSFNLEPEVEDEVCLDATEAGRVVELIDRQIESYLALAEPAAKSRVA